MLRLIRAENGMSIVGQGLRIILFTLPAAAVAVGAHLLWPDLVRIPALPPAILVALGVALLVPGVVLWGSALVQLLRGFPRGKLVSTGAYGVCRNPIYSSVALLILPGLSLATGTWVYLIVSATLLLGVNLFIGTEERELLHVFGDEYRRYIARVHRNLPFLKP